jgi:hypothetical protein
LPNIDAGYHRAMSISTLAARPLRLVRAPQLLALWRTFDDALADLDDEDRTDVPVGTARAA